MKRLMLAAALGATLAVVAAIGAVSTGRAVPAYTPTLEIRYAYDGCHTWALNGVDGVTHVLRVQAGQSIAVVNHDVCMHTLVQENASSLRLTNVAAATALRHVTVPSYPGDETLPLLTPASTAAPGAMLSFGAGVKVTFDQPGVYELGTVEADSILTNVWPTAGPDNDLGLKVIVTPSHTMPVD